jgi:hypothetical protein
VLDEMNPVPRRPGVPFMGYPSAALTSRFAPALYPQQSSCPSYTSRGSSGTQS